MSLSIKKKKKLQIMKLKEDRDKKDFFHIFAGDFSTASIFHDTAFLAWSEVDVNVAKDNR